MSTQSPPPDPTKSLRQQLADLHAWRVVNMRPEDLRINIDQRRELEETADRSRFIKAGDTVPPFRLPEADGGEVALDAVLAEGPAVLVFFRFAGCPACNIALPHYQRRLYPELRRRGATLIAISPQIPERLGEIRQRHGLEFPVVSDVDNRLGRAFGIVFTANAASQAHILAKSPGGLPAVTGTGTWDLPMPTVVVIGQDRVVRFADVAPDWLARTEAEPVLAAVDEVVGGDGINHPGRLGGAAA